MIKRLSSLKVDLLQLVCHNSLTDAFGTRPRAVRHYWRDYSLESND